MNCPTIITLLTALIFTSTTPTHAQSHSDLIQQAGNAINEKDRYQILTQLSQHKNLPEQLRTDLNIVLPLVDQWANGREKYWSSDEQTRAAENGYLCSFINASVRAYWENPTQIASTSPLYPIWAWYMGRMLIQRPIQSGGLYHNLETRQHYYSEARKLLKISQSAFPQNHIIGMYLEKPIPWPAINPPHSNAPDWANHQRESLEKLADILYFWIDERQVPDGQFGGGWGDDVEMWRHWSTILIGFNDPKINTAQATISNGLFALNRMSGGYTSHMTDVEHSAEDSGDTGTAMMHVAPTDTLWQKRARHLATLMKTLWTGTNQRGQLQFKSTYFTSETVHPDAQRACDTVYHPRAVQPALLLWLRTQDPQLTQLFSTWMDTWVDAAARAERGKPAGILPSAIHWPDGQIGGLGENWWDPQNHKEATLYQFPSAMNMMTSTLLQTYHITGNKKYLAPIQSMATMRAEYLANPTPNPEPGTTAWCASKMGFLSDTLGKYRLLTGDTQFDHLLTKDASGYVQYRLTNDPNRVHEALKQTTQAFRHDREAYTSEVRWTDRVMAYHSKYANHYLKSPTPRPDLGLLYSTVTGDFGNPQYFPLNAVRWQTTPQNMAALVTDHSTKHIQAQLYHFGNTDRKMGAEFYLLQPGTYTYELTSNNQTISTNTFTVSGPRTILSFTLPHNQLCDLKIQKKD